jgi:hypothetical protein
VRRSGRRGETALVAVMGLGVGILAGFALAEVVGKVDRRRVGRAWDRLTDGPGSGPLPSGPLSPIRAARAVSVALAKLPALATYEIETRALGPGRIELIGWVADRASRALAERTAAGIQGITGITNRLLVEGEDSDAPIEPLTLADQSA